MSSKRGSTVVPTMNNIIMPMKRQEVLQCVWLSAKQLCVCEHVSHRRCIVCVGTDVV